MKQGEHLYIRIDKPKNTETMSDADFQAHIAYLQIVSKERLFLGGGFSNIRGGMVIIRAESLEEADEIARKDPIIDRGFYDYRLYEWELVLLSEELIG